MKWLFKLQDLQIFDLKLTNKKIYTVIFKTVQWKKIRSKTTSEMRNDALMHPEGLKGSHYPGFLESKCEESVLTPSSLSMNKVVFNQCY